MLSHIALLHRPRCSSASVCHAHILPLPLHLLWTTMLTYSAASSTPLPVSHLPTMLTYCTSSALVAVVLQLAMLTYTAASALLVTTLCLPCSHIPLPPALAPSSSFPYHVHILDCCLRSIKISFFLPCSHRPLPFCTPRPSSAMLTLDPLPPPPAACGSISLARHAHILRAPSRLVVVFL
jgi:hypothetical protein